MILRARVNSDEQGSWEEPFMYLETLNLNSRPAVVTGGTSNIGVVRTDALEAGALSRQTSTGQSRVESCPARQRFMSKNSGAPPASERKQAV